MRGPRSRRPSRAASAADVIVWLDGRWLDADEASISIRDRGFLLSDGVYETGRLYDGGYFRLRAHLERLARSAAMFGLATPPASELEELAHELARRNDLRDASLRIIVTRGVSAPTVLLTLDPIAADWRERAARGWALATARTRRPPPEVVPPGLKTLGRPYALLARREAAAAGADDALLLNMAGEVAEGPSWNVFWRRGHVLRTPSLETGVLDGITRATLLEIAPRTGFTVEEGRWPRSELDEAEEMFATMSSLGVVPIRSLDGRPLKGGPAAERLAELYWQTVFTERVRIVRDPVTPVTPELRPERRPSAPDTATRQLELIGRVADDLAHEIRNPLNALIINIEVLRRRATAGDTAAVLERLAVLETEARRLHGLVDNLITLLRPARDDASVVRLGDALDPVLPLLGPIAGAAGLEVHRDPSIDDALVAVRPGALRFALLLLLEAAVRTTDGRHVAIAGRLDDRVAGVTIAFASRLSADDFAARTRDAITAAAELLEEGGGVVQAEAGRPPRDAMVRVLVPRVGAA